MAKSSKPCAITECAKLARNRGWCSMHYERWRKTGTTDSQRPTTEERFWSKVERTADPDECWIWVGTMHYITGYGLFYVHALGRNDGAHRVSYEWATGEKLGDRFIDHICFTRDCVNPKHLRAVTQKQNNEHRQGAQANSLSGVRGVSQTSSGKWQASAYTNGQNYIAGYFDTIEEADAAAQRLRSELFTHAD